MTTVVATHEALPSYSKHGVGTIANGTDRFESLSVNDDDDLLLPAPPAWFEDCDRDSLDVERESNVEHGATLDESSEWNSSDECHVDEALGPDHTRAPHFPGMGNNNSAELSCHGIQATDDNMRIAISAPFPAPSWTEISREILPMAARELLSSTMNRIHRTARFAYSKGRWKRQYSELGNNATGYFRLKNGIAGGPMDLPPFSSLSWIERQLVKEWRTYLPEDENQTNENRRETLYDKQQEDDDFANEDVDFHCARTLVPTPAQRPTWQRAEHCVSCNKVFGPTRLRHHCRFCGKSFCQAHSSCTHKLPHLGYHQDIPERVCDGCKIQLLEHNLAERVAWRLARCRDHDAGALRPYFDTGVDSLEEVAVRIAEAALTMAKKIPLGAQAAVAVETADVLRKYGLNGIYTIMLRKEFLAAADLLQKALGINRTSWPLSVHELSAAIFYALAQHRAIRGLDPEYEHRIHAIRESNRGPDHLQTKCEIEGPKDSESVGEEAKVTRERGLNTNESELEDSAAVCDRLHDATLESLIFYAPIALSFVYAEKEVDMQLLAAQQGWRLVYAHLDLKDLELGYDLPASALFVHDHHKIACLSIRGTSTIQDVVTDIRQAPLPFPETESTNSGDDWTEVHEGQGLAVCGMANAAVNLHREHIDSLIDFAKRGFRIRLTGHSLGGAVATMLGVLALRDLKKELPASFLSSPSDLKNCSATSQSALRVYAYGTPPCIDIKLSEFVEAFVTTAVLHDDAVPRLTPVSCRELLKFLLHIRETWVKEHLPGDILAITDRAKTAWAPRWREGFTLTASSSQLKRYCKSQIVAGKQRLLCVREVLARDDQIFGCYSGEKMSVWNSQSSELNSRVGYDLKAEAGDVTAALAVDFMGGLDARSANVIIDDDEFYDPNEKLLEDSGDEDFDDALDEEVNGESAFSEKYPGRDDTSLDQNGKDDQEPVMLEESLLPRMFVPGKIVHIYSQRGIYKAVYVPRDFRELRRVSLAGNMLSDHKCKYYYEALLEVRTVRRAQEAPPRWTAFDEDDTCSCCASRFTWASTFDNEAQEARDKHNCRSCGTLVCDQCSQNRVPLPSVGLTVPVRICDRCYFDIDGVVGSPFLNQSLISGLGDTISELKDTDDLPQRQRQRRSAVVDDLAAQLKANSNLSDR